jgi:hypothetical protein
MVDFGNLRDHEGTTNDLYVLNYDFYFNLDK